MLPATNAEGALVQRHTAEGIAASRIIEICSSASNVTGLMVGFHDPSPRVEVLYPRAGMNPVSVDVATAACYQYLVEIFCKETWIRPDKQAIEDALKVALNNRQSRYGKTIVPDIDRLAGNGESVAQRLGFFR
jgi:hypothetical protein